MGLLPQTVKKALRRSSRPQTRKNFNHFFGGVYVEKVLCGPNSARSPFSKKWLRHFFDTQRPSSIAGGPFAI